MKTFVKSLLFCTVIALCTSCKKVDESSENYIPFPEVNVHYPFQVIRFTNPIYKDFLVVRDFYDVSEWRFYPNWPMVINYQNLGNETYYGKSLNNSPYIELIDDYLLVDWRWSCLLHFGDNKKHANLGLVVLTEQKWSDFTDFSQTWSFDTPHDHNAFDRAYFFSIEGLDKYRGDNLTKEEIDKYYEPYDKDASWTDSIQNIYVKCLKNILQKYDFGEDGGRIKELE